MTNLNAPALTTAAVCLAWVASSSACANPAPNIYEATRLDGNSAKQTSEEHAATQQKIKGLLNSACNKEQYQYLVLEAAYNDALFADSACQPLYDSATTISDVNIWLVCESLALPLVLGASNIQREFSAANSEALSQRCSFCADAPSPPALLSVQSTDPQNARGVQIIAATLDLAGKIRNFQSLAAEKAVASLIEQTFAENVKSAVLTRVHDDTQALVQTVITKGYNATTGGASGLLRRSVDPAAMQLMNTSLDITAAFQLVAVEKDYTFAQLQSDASNVLNGKNFTSALQKMSGKITSQEFEQARAESTSATPTTTGTAVTGSSTSKSHAALVNFSGCFFGIIVSIAILVSIV